MTLQQWLQDPSDYETGRKLYEQYGRNSNLKKIFKNGRLKDKLIYELGKILQDHGNVVAADWAETTSEPVFTLITPPFSETEKDSSNEDSSNVDSSNEDSSNVDSTAGLEFSSLLSGMKEEPLDNPLLDDINEQLTPLYRKRTILHSQLTAFPNDEERKAAAYGILDYTEKIEELLDKKEHVEKHGTLPDQRPAQPETVLTDPLQIHKRIKNLSTYISKHQANSKRAKDVEAWKEEKELLEKQLNEKA